jgi:hypothetical protein
MVVASVDHDVVSAGECVHKLVTTGAAPRGPIASTHDLAKTHLDPVAIGMLGLRDGYKKGS